jgi:hypothetical protein
VIRVFGFDHKYGMERVPTPVGRPCGWCLEPIGEKDEGLLVDPGDAEDAAPVPWHRDCYMRQVMGSLGHMMQECSCFGGNRGDPAGVSKREAATIAVQFWERFRVPIPREAFNYNVQETAMPEQKWFYLLATDAVAYPESCRPIVHEFMARKRLRYPNEAERRPVTIVPWHRLPELPGDDTGSMEFIKLSREWGDRGDSEHVCYALEKICTRLTADQGGMARVNRPMVEVTIPGLRFETPAENLAMVVSRIDAAEPERLEPQGELKTWTTILSGDDAGVARVSAPFFEVGFFLRSLIFGEAEKRQLVAALTAAAPEAERRQAEFDRAYDLAHPGGREIAAKINAGTHGVGHEGLEELPGKHRPN